MGIVETCRNLDQWLPALGPVGSDDGSMDEARWATILANTAFVDEAGEKPKAEVLDSIRHRLLVFGGRDFPPDVPWVEKWIHFPEPGSWPVPAILEVWLLDEGEDLDLYDMMIRPRQVEDPIVEWVEIGLGEGMRGLTYFLSDADGEEMLLCRLTYAWRVEHEEGIAGIRAWIMSPPDRVLAVQDDFAELVDTFRFGE
jgi:hypothetical protein